MTESQAKNSKYRHDWKPFGMGMSVIYLVEIFTFFLVNRAPLILIVGLVAIVLIPIFSILLMKFIDFITPIHLDALGISSYTAFGIRTHCNWSQVTVTRNLIFWPGLQWLLLLDGRSIFRCACIPVFLLDRPTFYAEVSNCAGENHPVTIRLRELGFNRQKVK